MWPSVTSASDSWSPPASVAASVRKRSSPFLLTMKPPERTRMVLESDGGRALDTTGPAGSCQLRDAGARAGNDSQGPGLPCATEKMFATARIKIGLLTLDRKRLRDARWRFVPALASLISEIRDTTVAAESARPFLQGSRFGTLAGGRWDYASSGKAVRRTRRVHLLHEAEFRGR